MMLGAKMFGFSGRIGRSPYAIFTIVFAALVIISVIQYDGAAARPFTHLLTDPWAILGRSLDDLIRLRSIALDFVVSAIIAMTLTWTFFALTVRRLRDLGQSPWWALMIAFGLTVPGMLVLSIVRRRSDRPVTARNSTVASGLSI